MKPEFSEVRLIEREERNHSKMSKIFMTSGTIFAFIVAIVLTGFIVRYEDKLGDYEGRIALLEEELFGIRIVEGYRNLVANTENEMAPQTILDEMHVPSVKKGEDGEVNMDTRATRNKRQIPTQELPVFGPEVERTRDGVPILEKSYLDGKKNEPIRPAAAFFARFDQPSTTESEGLRLYEGLLTSGSRGRPELRSLDAESLLPPPPNGAASHRSSSSSSSSGAWAKKITRRLTKKTSTTLRSGDSEATYTSTVQKPPPPAPHFSEESSFRSSSGLRSSDTSSASSSNGSGRRSSRRCTTTRINENGRTTTTSSSSHGNGGKRCATNGAASSAASNSAAAHSNSNSNFESSSSNSQSSSSTSTRSLQSSSSNANQGSNGFTCITANCRTGSSISSDNPSTHITYHRRSRVPSSDILLPPTPPAELRSLQFPPLQRLGRGDQEVLARVVESDNNENEQDSNGHVSRQSARAAYQGGKKLNKKYYRRTIVKNFTTQAFPSEEYYSFTSS